MLRALLGVGHTETHPMLALNPSQPHLPDRGAQLAKGHRQPFLLKLHVTCIFVCYFIKLPLRSGKEIGNKKKKKKKP